MRNALTLFIIFTDRYFTSLWFFMIKLLFSLLFARIWFLLSIG